MIIIITIITAIMENGRLRHYACIGSTCQTIKNEVGTQHTTESAKKSKPCSNSFIKLQTTMILKKTQPSLMKEIFSLTGNVSWDMWIDIGSKILQKFTRPYVTL